MKCLKEHIIWWMLGFVVVMYLLNLSMIFFVDSSTDRGTFGDQFGAVNALFSGLAFAGLIYTIILQRRDLALQRKDLALQRKELELTRGELKNQTGQQEEQNKILRIQRFENTFFQMLTQFQEIVNDLTFSYTMGGNTQESQRREIFYETFENVFHYSDIETNGAEIYRYKGMREELDTFAENVNKKLKTAGRVMEFISGIQGAGYLLQALYLSNDVIRRDVILTALDLSLDTNEAFKKMATLPDTQFKNYRIPLVQMLSLIHFYEMFNSLTLKTPLEMSYKVLKDKYEKCIDDEHSDKSIVPAIGYQLSCLAFTLDSKRIGNDEPLSYLLGQKPLLGDTNINSLVGISLELLGKTKYKELRDQVRKDYHSLNPINQALLDEASSKARFSALDTVHPFRKVKLFVEGRSDAIILEHAFLTLTHGRFPYWNVEMATQNGVTGSTHAVSKAIDAGINYSETYDFIIGIFDHDKAGLAAYQTLNKDYNELEEDCIKQNKIKSNVYLLCIPVPGEMKQYLQKRQDLNFFEIEHYFGHEYLRSKDMLKEDILNCEVYEISDNKKSSFSTSVTTETEPSVFRMFTDLFKKIDQITGAQIDYDEAIKVEA